MKEGQDAIYYITADGFAAARNSPHLEIFRKLGVEVLLLYDRVDEWVVVDAAPSSTASRCSRSRKGDLDLEQARRRGGEAGAGAAQAGEHKAAARAHAERRSRTAPARVRVTHRLTDSPACLVSDEHGMSTQPRAAC